MPLTIVVLYNTEERVLAELRAPPLSTTVTRVLSCDRAAAAAGAEGDAESAAECAVPEDACGEFDSMRTVEAYRRFFEALGHRVVLVHGDVHAVDALRALAAAGTPADLCWNVCEGFRGLDREAQMPALLELLGVPYTFARPLALAVTLNKALTKRLLQAHGLPTPAFQEFARADEPLCAALAGRWPLFVKPNAEGTGMGVTARSLVRTEAELRAALRATLGAYGLTALVEEFVPGRDVTCGIVGTVGDTRGVCVLAVNEVDYAHTRLPADLRAVAGADPDSLFYTSAIKALRGDDFHALCPAPLPEAVTREVQRLTVEVCRVCMARDAARVDFRLDTRGGRLTPTVIEINPIPGMMDESDLTICARGIGASHEQLVDSILAAACDRYGLAHNVSNRLQPNWPPKE